MRKKNLSFKKGPSQKLFISNENRNGLSIMPPLARNNSKSEFTPDINREVVKNKLLTTKMPAEHNRNLFLSQISSNKPKTPATENIKLQQILPILVKMLPAKKSVRSNSQMFTSIYPEISKNVVLFPTTTKQQKSEYDDYIQQIFKLTVQPIIDARNTPAMIAQKQRFIEVLRLVLEMLSQNQSFIQRYYFNLSKELEQICQQMYKIMASRHRKKESSKLALTNALKYRITPQENYQYKNTILSNISSLLIQLQGLQQKVNYNEQNLQKLVQMCKAKQRQLIESEKKVVQLETCISQYNLKIEGLSRQVQQKEKFLSHLNFKAEQILNFVDLQQEKKVLQWVSEAYKQIQAEIYDYACYLQCNAMASSLTWEPKPFRAVQKWVYEEMERVNVFVTSKAESFEDKVAKMRDFVTNTTRKFRTKDQEMMKIADFKTECIKKFTKMMQKWLQNWELKQEYLVTLRKQFAIQSEKFQNIFARLYTQSKEEQNCTKPNRIKSYLDSLKIVWNKLVLNYKYGNSFY